MNDFIKVNYANGSMIFYKKDLILTQGKNFFVAHSKHDDLFYKDGAIMGYYITKEEYDRLCKELGVK